MVSKIKIKLHTSSNDSKALVRFCREVGVLSTTLGIGKVMNNRFLLNSVNVVVTSDNYRAFFPAEMPVRCTTTQQGVGRLRQWLTTTNHTHTQGSFNSLRSLNASIWEKTTAVSFKHKRQRKDCQIGRRWVKSNAPVELWDGVSSSLPHIRR